MPFFDFPQDCRGYDFVLYPLGAGIDNPHWLSLTIDANLLNGLMGGAGYGKRVFPVIKDSPPLFSSL